MVENKHGDRHARVIEGKRGTELTCVGDVCFTDDGQLEVHLRTDDPKCAALTEVLAKHVLQGGATKYVIDPPRDVEKGPPKGRKD